MTDVGPIRYLFTGRIEERDGSYVVEIPEREIEDGSLEPGQESRIGVFAVSEGGGSGGAAGTAEAVSDQEERQEEEQEEVATATASGGGAGSAEAAGDGSTAVEPTSGDGSVSAGSTSEGGDGSGGEGATADNLDDLDEVQLDEEEPPVSEGDTRRVEIEDEGEQGDGLARIDRGYIVFVPETEPGDTVEIEITDAKENYGFGKIVE